MSFIGKRILHEASLCKEINLILSDLSITDLFLA